MASNAAGRYAAAALMLASAVGIYLTSRPEVILRGYARLLPLTALPEGAFFRYIVYSLPDALWYASLLTLQSNPFRKKGLERTAALCALLLPYLHEGLQGCGAVGGTFCMLDLISYISVTTIFILIWQRNKILPQRQSCKSPL